MGEFSAQLLDALFPKGLGDLGLAGRTAAREIPRDGRPDPYADGKDLASSREFYVEVLGLEVAMEDPVLGLRSPTDPRAQLIICPPGMEDPQPQFGIDVDEPAAVDAAHDEAVRRGLKVVYPLTNEPWGVRRFFVEEPGGAVVNILAHIA